MKIAIIGGGMSGLATAVMLDEHHDITIYEAFPRVGKKISMTGNGRCNISNGNISCDCYNLSSAYNVVSSNVASEDVNDFFNKIGLYTYSDNMGRLYPLSDNSNTVVDCLRLCLDRQNITINTECEVTAISGDKPYVVFDNHGRKQQYDAVVLACGGLSGLSQPSLSNIINPAHMTQLVPSLVPVTTAKPSKALNGIRCKVDATLLCGSTKVATRSGEVLFKDYGLSGICIFELTHYIANGLKNGEKQNYSIELDLLPSIEYNKLVDIITSRSHCDKTNLLVGLLHNKLAADVLDRAKSNKASDIAYAIKHHKHDVKSLLGFNMSQVTCGGIDNKYINDKLMYNSKYYVVGELLDVNGNCGGYNLDFAIRSAIYVSRMIG